MLRLLSALSVTSCFNKTLLAASIGCSTENLKHCQLHVKLCMDMKHNKYMHEGLVHSLLPNVIGAIAGYR